MNKRFLILLILAIALVQLFTTGCSNYVCNSTFSNNNCAAGGGGGGKGGGGGGGGSNADAFAFAVNTNGTLDGFTLDTTGGTFAATSGYTAPVIPGADPGVGMVIAQGKYLYTVLEGSSSLFGWSIDSSGNLTALSGFPVTPFSFNAPIVTFNEYNMALNPTGTLLFLSSTGANEIFVFQIGTGGTLTQAPGSPVTTPVEPGNLATDGLGKFLYVTENPSGHIGFEILGYSIGTGSSLGQLTAIPNSPYVFPMWQLQGDPTGKFMVGTSGKTQTLASSDDKNLYVFAIQQSGTNAGALTAVANSPFATSFSPLNIAVQPGASTAVKTGVYSFGINDTGTADNPIEGFSLNTSTGTLTAISGSPFSNGITAGPWGQFDPSGNFLFVYTVTSTGVELGAITVASDGTLTEPIAPTALGTTGYWAVTDPQ